MKGVFEKIADPTVKVRVYSPGFSCKFSDVVAFQKTCASVLSVMAMTMSTTRESIKFKLMGTKEDIGSWGHEYVRWELFSCVDSILVLF